MANGHISSWWYTDIFISLIQCEWFRTFFGSTYNYFIFSLWIMFVSFKFVNGRKYSFIKDFGTRSTKRPLSITDINIQFSSFIPFIGLFVLFRLWAIEMSYGFIKSRRDCLYGGGLDGNVQKLCQCHWPKTKFNYCSNILNIKGRLSHTFLCKLKWLLTNFIFFFVLCISVCLPPYARMPLPFDMKKTKLSFSFIFMFAFYQLYSLLSQPFVIIVWPGENIAQSIDVARVHKYLENLKNFEKIFIGLEISFENTKKNTHSVWKCIDQPTI